MTTVQKSGRTTRRGRRMFGALGMLGAPVAALVLAVALLAACGAAGTPAGADAPTDAPSDGGKQTTAPAVGEPSDAGETDIKDSKTPLPSGDKATDDEFVWTEGKLIKPDGGSSDNGFREGASFLFAADQGDLFTVHGDFDIIDKDGEPLDESSLKAGVLLRIEYDLILDSYPGQVAPRTVQVMGEGDDMVGLYSAMLDEIWNMDKGLNPGEGELLAIDVEEVANLTGGEKDALVWLAGSRFKVYSMASTFEKLEEEGYIDGVLLQFKDENGMLIKISTSDVKEGSFKFRISKWVSGVGADWCDDCTASKKDGVWSFEFGGFAVS